MRPHRSREELFDHYKSLSGKEWDEYINALTVPKHAVTYPLYHLSFALVESGVWSPLPTRENGSSEQPHPIYGEMLPTRISTSSTIEGCWAGVFAYLFSDLKGLNNGHKRIEAYLYKATPCRGARILTPDVLSEFYLVQDAHLTQEHCILGDANVQLDSKIVFENTTKYPESKWINSHPFNEKRYGKTNYAPMVILDQTPLQPETTSMQSLQLNFSNEQLEQQLSLEAMSNPLSALSEGMTTKFTVLLSQLNNITTGLTKATGVTINHIPTVNVQSRKLRKITQKNNYMQLMHYSVNVPPGFIGPLVPYMGLLIETLNTFKDIRNDITIPVSREMGVILANPDRLKSATISPLKKIDFKDKYRDQFTKRVNSYYNPKSMQDEAVFSRLFNDNADFLKSGDMAENIEELLNRMNNEIAGVLEDIGTISNLADKLAVRLVQDRKTYSVNAKIAYELANVISSTAKVVGFVGSLIVMSEESVGIVDNLTKKIK